MNSNFTYKISRINEKDKWIFISSNGNYDEPDAFIALVKGIAEQSNEKITDIGYCRYKISNQPYDMTFQWDDLFGIVVEYKNADDKENVSDYLLRLINCLKGI